MNTHATRTLRTSAHCLSLAALSLVGLGVAACSDDAPPVESVSTAADLPAVEPTAWAGSQTITLDGDVSEWPEDVAAVADAHYLYLRFKLEGPTRTLQGMDTPVAIH